MKEIKEMKNMKKWAKSGLFSFVATAFIAFVVGWLFLIPLAVIVLLIYGYMAYMKDRKHRITVEVKPTEAMKALARREAALKKEKEILYEELGQGKIR